MHIEDFQQLSKRTAPDNGQRENALNFIIGAFGELSETSELIKKWAFHNHPLDTEKIANELGDVMWYIVNLATEFDLDMDLVLEGNINKLFKRYPNGFNTEDSIKRVDVEVNNDK